MPTDAMPSRESLTLSQLHGSAAGVDRDDALGTIAWWLSGGMALLIWTGIALLLTGA